MKKTYVKRFEHKGQMINYINKMVNEKDISKYESIIHCYDAIENCYKITYRFV